MKQKSYFEAFLEAFDQVQVTAKNKFLISEKHFGFIDEVNGEIGRLVSLLADKLEEISLNKVIPSDCEFIFKLLENEWTQELIDKEVVLGFLENFIRIGGALSGNHVTKFLLTPKVKENICENASKNSFAKFLIVYLDASIRGGMNKDCGKSILIDWALAGFDGYEDVWCEIAFRLQFLQDLSLISKDNQAQRDIIEAFEPYASDDVGVFNEIDRIDYVNGLTIG